VPICPSKRRPDDGAPGKGVGRGLGRLYGTVLPWRDGVVMEISVTTPFGNGNNVP